jgi:16S rRNA A1518/A1519 N6-dimethyltransferase RsmA/KsgA/DIM1 with predicted DNA glycosylase/AP lyase activity
LRFNDNLDNNINKKTFVKIVKACFGNRRKTLKNSLSNSIFSNYDFSSITDMLHLRAEKLSIKNFIDITRLVQNQDAQIKTK